MNIKQVKWLFAVLAVVMASVVLADPAQDVELAEKALHEDDLPKAMELYKAAALQSYAPAQVRYAELLDDAEENETAVFWFKIATEQGSAAGEMGLGAMYIKGEGVKPDPDKGLYWIRHAAEQNYLPAVDLLVKTYQGQAQFWEEKAAFLKAKADAERTATEKAATEKTTDKPSK